MEYRAREHSLPLVYLSPTTTQRVDGIKVAREQEIDAYVKFIDDNRKKSPSATGGNEAHMFFIPKIPEILRRGENDTGPKIISIGPYHRGKPRLQSMEDEKFRRLDDMLPKSCPDDKLSETRLGLLKDIVEVLAPLEDQVRRCYSGNCVVNSKDFVEMMLLDSWFIIRLLLLVTTDATKLDGMGWIKSLLFNDLLLLENQLPFHLIERVYEITKKCHESSQSLVELTLSFYHAVSETEKHRNEHLFSPQWFSPPAKRVHHLLQLYHWLQILPLIGVSTQKPPKSKCIKFCREKWIEWIEFCRESKWFKFCREKWTEWIEFCPIFHDSAKKNNDEESESEWIDSCNDEESGITIPNATALHEAGIKFKKKKGDWILDVNFSDGVLEIPHLIIRHGTVSVFQSLIALEHCLGFYNNNLPQLTVYFYFMDHIINTVNDVSLLQKSGIIEYAHGSEAEVADLFNQLTRGATINPNNYLSGLYKDVNRYCKKKRHNWRAILLRRHFSNPWTILSLIGALILLDLTFIQSYFSVYAYFRPPSTSPSSHHC